MTDITAFPNSVSLAQETFAAWFTLQHMRGYKPFITKATFKESFQGNINEGKFDRVKKRNADSKALRESLEGRRE